MAKSKNTKRALLASVLSLMLCAAMLVGSTFAWFTDSVTSGVNKIVAGNLDVELYAKDDTGYTPVTAETELFLKNTLWEPGHVEVVNLKVANLGSLALQYKLGINVAGEKPGTNVDSNKFNLSDYIQFALIDGEKTFAKDAKGRAAAITEAEKAESKKLSELAVDGNSVLYPKDTAGKASEKFVTLVVYMPTTVDNTANYLINTDAPTIDLGVNLVATQTPFEEDSFGNDYDHYAVYPDATTVETSEDLKTAIGEAKDGDVIALTSDMPLSENLTIDKDLTIYGNGMTIKTNSVYVGENNTVTFKNVNFMDTTGGDKTSSVYGSSFKGTMVFDGCTFGDSNWESIQITPGADATIIIKNCTFAATKDMKRFIHIEPAADNTYKLDITIENCTFTGCEKVNYGTSGINLLTVIDLDYIATGSTMKLGGCTFTNTDGTENRNVRAYFCKPQANVYEQTYSFEQMYTMLTGEVATYTVE